MNTFANRIRELRIEKGMTCQAVALAVGLTKNAITNYESGIRQPSLETLKKLCDLFDVSADYLIGRSENY